MKNYRNVGEQKGNSNSPETKPEVTEDHNVTDSGFKTVIIEKLSELQENSERHFNKVKNKINVQKEYFIK